jgi:hypothetical protein
MNRILALAFLFSALAAAAGRHDAITGVWRVHMDGVPALVMTVSDEGGELTGAILFYLIRRDEGRPPRSIPGHPEPLFHLKFDGKALDFRVSHRRSHGARTANDPPVSFRLTITGPNEAELVREKDVHEAMRAVRDK